MEALLSVSPWRELFWLAVGGLFFSLLCVSGALLRAALWPPPRTGRRAVETRAVSARGAEADDLETIEGIGPGVAALLRAQGISSYAELAAERPARLRRILARDADLARAQPSTWPLQARLLAEGRHGDFVRLIAVLKCGVPRLESIIEECCAGRLRAGGICTIAELQRSTVSQVVSCFPQNDRAQITRLAPRWIEQAYLLHEGDEAALCALAGIRPPSGPLRLQARRTAARTAVAEDVLVTETALLAYWQRESWLRLLCAPLLALVLLLFLLLVALLGLIPSRPPWPPNPPYPPIIVPGGNNSFRIMAGTAPSPDGNNQGSNYYYNFGSAGGGSGNGGYWQYGPYGPYPYPTPYPTPYPVPYPLPYPQPNGWGSGACCPNCQQTACPPAPTPTPPPAPRPTPVPTPPHHPSQPCGCELDYEAD